MVTAAQSGKTETMLDILGERLDNRPVPILYVGPSKEFNTDQFEPRLRDLFLQSPSLLGKVIGGLDGKRQKKTLKRVAGVTLRLGTARSPTSLKSSPAGLALVDEYDEMLANLRDQGDVLGLIVARGETYQDFAAGVTSTPSQGTVEFKRDPVSGLEFWDVAEEADVTSPIWRLWQRGSRMHWCWPCPHCSLFFVPRRERLRYPEGATAAQAQRDSWLECPRCKDRIFEHHKAEMNRRGVYVAPGQAVTATGEVTGNPPEGYPSRWVSGLCSPFKSFGDRAHRLLEAIATGESGKVQTAINAAFGEVAPAASVDAPDHEAVAAKVTGHRANTVPDGVLTIVAAIDVQKHCLYFVIRGFGARGTSWLIRHGALWGPTKDPEVWNKLTELLTTPIEGRFIKIAVVDSGFRPGQKAFLPINRVYEFCRRHRRFVFPSKGSSVPMLRPLVEIAHDVETEDGSGKRYGLKLLRLDAGHWKSTVHERLGLDSDVPGCMHLNADADEDYRRQLVAEQKVTGPTGHAIWVPVQKANHFLDCEAMAFAAAFRLSADHLRGREPEKVSAPRVAPVRPAPGSTPAPAPAPPRPAPAIPPPRPLRSMADYARRLNRR